MPRITQIRYGLPVEVTLTFDERGGHPWNGQGVKPEDATVVTYDPGWQKIRYYRALDEARKPDSPDSPVIVEFMAAVKSWDVQDEKGKPIPIEAKALEDVPVDLLRGIVNGCTEHMLLPKSAI